MPMQAGVTRPTVFVSSTIQDFADLRDALRFWLEEMGFEVQMSEHTDFKRRPESGTFEACFEAIQQSDFYVLLIGKRRGAWYDETNRVTVTRQEYRCALDSFETCQKPRVVAVVRSEILAALRERKALGSPEGASTLEDWAFTSEFIREVRREEEVRAATQGSAEHPVSNWLSPFRDFRELVAILRSTLAVKGPLPRVALLEALRDECEFNLRIILMKHAGQPFYSHWWLDRTRREVVLTTEQMRPLRGTVSVTFEQMKHIVAFHVGGVPSPDNFVRVALNEAVASGGLLDYDRARSKFVPSPILSTIYRLREELDTYSHRVPFLKERQEELSSAWEEAKRNRRSTQVPAMTLFALYAVHDNVQNIARLLIGILRHIYGHTVGVEAQLRPSSPIAEFEEDLRREKVSPEELVEWLESDNVFLLAGMEETEEQRSDREATEKRAREVLGDEVFDQLMSELNNKLMELKPKNGNVDADR